MNTDHDPDVVKSFLSRLRRQLTMAKGQPIRLEVHSRSEAEAIVQMLSPSDKNLVRLFWEGSGPPESREV